MLGLLVLSSCAASTPTGAPPKPSDERRTPSTPDSVSVGGRSGVETAPREGHADAKEIIANVIVSAIGAGRFETADLGYNENSSVGKLIVLEYSAQKPEEPTPSLDQVEQQSASMLKALCQSPVAWDRVWISADVYNAAAHASDKTEFSALWNRSALRDVNWVHIDMRQLVELAVEPPIIGPGLRR